MAIVVFRDRCAARCVLQVTSKRIHYIVYGNTRERAQTTTYNVAT